MELFILLLVLTLLSGMVFTFVKACQVASLEHQVLKLETDVAELKKQLRPPLSRRVTVEKERILPVPAAAPETSPPSSAAAPPVRETIPAPAVRNTPNPVRPAAPSPALPLSFSWEYFIGAKLLSWIGGFIFFLGAGFFVKYSIENELISPEWRVILTYLAAVALLGAGLSRLKKRYPTLSGTLTATGILVLYLATCAGRMFYGLPFFNTPVSILLLTATTAAAFVLAVRLRFRVIAALGIIGGFLTPVILSAGQDHTVSLFLYMTLLNAGLISVLAVTRWTGMGAVGLAAHTLLLMFWFDECDGNTHIPAVTLLSFCTLLLYGGYGLFAGKRQEKAGKGGFPFLLAFGAIAVACLTAFRLQVEGDPLSLTVSSRVLLLLAGMFPMIFLLPLAKAKSTYWAWFLPVGIFTISYLCLPAIEEPFSSPFPLFSELLRGLFCIFMILASYEVLSARTPSGGASLADLHPGVRISCFTTAALAWLLVIWPSAHLPFYVFLTTATFCGMAAWYGRGQAVMAAAAGYALAAWQQDIHPAGSAVIFLALFLFPVALTPRFRDGLLAWSASALCAPLFFGTWWLYGMNHNPAAVHFWDSTAAFLCAIPPFLAALHLQRLPYETLLKRPAVLSFYYGTALGMLTLAIGLQWSGTPLSLAWSLEGFALLLLCGKFPQPKLAWTGFFLLAILFVHDGLFKIATPLEPARMPELRLTCTTLIFCCMAGAWWMQKKVMPLLTRFGHSGLRFLTPALNIFGAILLFIWMNMEISCGFACAGDRPLMIEFGRSLAQDLTISMAWSLFALGLIATGFDIRSARVRMAGLALLGITLLKVVCYDISSLSQLYRVGALVGLAVIVLLSSFLYQKFNMKMRGKKKTSGSPFKS